MKILHVISYPRSGSTVVGLTLGHYQESTYLGEVSAVFTGSWDRSCGCSLDSPVNMKDCPMWSPVLQKSKTVLEKYNLWDNSDPGVTKELRLDFLPTAYNQLKLGQPGAELKAANEIIDIIFHQTSKITKSPIVVDSSKNLYYYRILKKKFGEDHFSLHLFRDPRGVVYSARRRPVNTNKGIPLSLKRSLRIALGWGAKNFLIESYIKNNVGDSIQLHYEDWCSDPKRISDHIIDSLVQKRVTSPFLDHSSFKVEPSHSFHGNRSRRSSGTMEIKNDQSWKKGMDKKYQSASKISALLFMKKYNY